MSDNYSRFWNYLSQGQKDLITEGEYLIKIVGNSQEKFKDYSFLIFPYAKAYEGFLKQLFKDIKFISHLDYISDHLRLGKLLSPNLIGRLGERSLYKKIRDSESLVDGNSLANRIWMAWKIGRNQIFHYFPHNLKAVTLEQAKEIITEIIATMEEAFTKLKPQT